MPLMLGVMAMVMGAIGPDDFTMTMPISPETEEGQQLLSARAREICGARYPLLTRYRFSGDERVAPDGARSSSFEVSQELTCSETPPAPQAEAAPPIGPEDWQPGARDEAEVRAATQAYFAANDRGDATAAHGMWSANEQAAHPIEARAAALREFRTRAGRPGAHRIARLTWYLNPPGAPRPGHYVAVDYERSYSGLLFNCGYLVWFREGEGRYVLIREETNVFGAGQVPPEDIARAREMARCPAP